MKQRDYSIDILRGSGIIFMLITHVNAIFSSETTGLLNTLTFWGATVCFSIFLFCFAYIYGRKIALDKFYPKLTLIKAGYLLIAYYFTAITASIFLNNGISFVQIGKILSFQLLPEYTEFILAFVLYSIIVVIFAKIFRKLLQLPILLLLIAAVIYILANLLYKVDFGANYLTDIKSLFVGNLNWHRFGILNYFPIFSLGLIWGDITNNEKYTQKFKTIITASVFIISMLAFVIFRSTGISTWLRWPPSLEFFTYGIIFISAILTIYPLLKRIPQLLTAFSFLSRHSLAYFILNVIIILGAGWLFNYTKLNAAEVILANIVTFVIITSFILLRDEVKITRIH